MLLRLLALFLLLAPAASFAQALKVKITDGVVEPLPIALPYLPGTSAEGEQVGVDIMRVVAADLERSGLFRPVSQGAFIEKITASTATPRFPDWRQINAQALVTGVVTAEGGDKIRISFRLWDVLGEQQIAGKEYNTFRSNWRRTAHIMADEIYKRLTGENGYFDTRIVYVAESGPATKRIKRLAIMDQDGENHKFLTDGRFLALTPRFSANSQEILYMSFAGKQPRVFMRDLQSGREESLGTFEGMSFAPRFTPDGGGIIMSIARSGLTNLYLMNLSSRQLRPITSGGGIDTSPSHSPDGKKIAFNSDRGGSQQLYVMDAGGGNVTRISFGDGRYATPVWSPRGDLIAFTKMVGGQFYIGVMRPDGSGERVFPSTAGYIVEGPSWAPNGRVIVFTKQSSGGRGQGGRSRLYTVDVTGQNLRELVTPMDASDAAWSPLLPL